MSDSLRGLEVTHSVCLAAWYAMVDADTTPYSMQLAACSPPSMRPSPSAMAHGRAKRLRHNMTNVICVSRRATADG